MSSARSIRKASGLFSSFVSSFESDNSRAQVKWGLSDSYAPHLSRIFGCCPRSQGYLRIAFRVALVRFRPGPSDDEAASAVTILKLWALPSKPSARQAEVARRSSSRSAVCPNGGWPRSCAKHAASTTSGSISLASACCSRNNFSAMRRPTWQPVSNVLGDCEKHGLHQRKQLE